jgi:hypothetical protein
MGYQPEGWQPSGWQPPGWQAEDEQSEEGVVTGLLFVVQPERSIVVLAPESA